MTKNVIFNYEIATYSIKFRTPMMWAAENGHNECLSLLLESDACPRIADNDGFTALHRAVSSPYHSSTIYIIIFCIIKKLLHKAMVFLCYVTNLSCN